MSSFSSNRFAILVLLVVGLWLPANVSRGQIESVSLGIQGNVKLGYWVPARIRFRGELPENLVTRISLPDTDGIQTTFTDTKPLIRNLGDVSQIETLVKLGRAKGMLNVRLLKDKAEQDAELLAEKQSSLASVCNPVDPLVEFYVSLGKAVEIKGAAAIGGKNEYAPAISTAISAKDIVEQGAFGNHWKSFESIDGLIIEAGSFADAPLPFTTQTALVAWVNQGGRMAITGGKRLKDFFELNPELASLIQGEILGSRRLNSTAAIERAVKAVDSISGQRDRPFVAITRNMEGEILIREGQNSVMIRKSVGFGKLLLVTVNLAEQPISDWSDRKSFSGLTLSELAFSSDGRRNQEQRSSRFGYQDFSGQLRTALDDFSSVSMVNFTVVAAIAILFIALIGPIDYFLLKRFSSRMEFTWISFSIIVIFVCGLTFWIHRSTKPGRLICRQVEIVDIDAKKQLARGSVWSHIYSPVSQKYSIGWDADSRLERPVQFVSWFGFPGNALGGMDNRTLNTSSSANYQVDIQKAQLDRLPINVAATKGLQMDWMAKVDLGRIQKPSIVRNGLVGRFANPLDIELEYVFVIHNRSIYQLTGKLGPGESFDIEADTKERNLVDYLNLRKVKQLGTEATPWSIADTNLKRILEVMMFYEKAGGRGYVNLFQRYLNHVDFSHSINNDQAILVGRTKKPVNEMTVNGESLNAEDYEESWTYYRILVPVEKKTGASSSP